MSNLYCQKDFTHELGMRVDLSTDPDCPDLDQTVENIKKKQFMLMRAEDTIVKERIKKMENRGWKMDPKKNQFCSESRTIFWSYTFKTSYF